MKSVFLLITATSLLLSQDIRSNLPVSSLDYESQQCMRCHDGTSGHGIVLRENGSAITYDDQHRTTNHSIGMNYIKSFRNDSRHYVSPASLNPKVQLIDGKVGCVSCHVQKNRELASNSGSFTVDTNCSVDTEATEKAFNGGLCNQCHLK